MHTLRSTHVVVLVEPCSSSEIMRPIAILCWCVCISACGLKSACVRVSGCVYLSVGECVCLLSCCFCVLSQQLKQPLSLKRMLE